MIRPVTPNDAEAIAAIYNEYVLRTTISFEEKALSCDDMRRRITAIAADYPYLVYEEQGEVAGYCYVHAWKERPVYRHTAETTIYLSPAHTGKGIGRQLMQALVEACRQQGLHTLIACITADNTTSRRLHERLGFRQASHFSQVGFKFGQWLDVVDYELVIG